MSEHAMGDEVYQPTGDNEEQEDVASPDMEDALDEDGYDEILDKGYSAPERPYAVGRTGTTAAEQREGESLDERLAEEIPDTAPTAGGDGVGDSQDTEGEPVDPEAGDQRAGRLLAPDQGLEHPVKGSGVAQDVGIDGAAASAEEAAVHVVDDPEEPSDGSS